ncbi:MAG: hypothetical protein IPJ98_24895 [Bryobacterales bacterium]|nr:hypothetical protein [Bryobacterales bacterium]
MAMGLWAQEKPAAAGLAIVEATLSQYEDGTPMPATYRHFPGETVYLAFRIQGYRREEKQDERNFLKLNWKVELRDPAGRLVVRPGSGKIDAELAEQDKEWKPKQRWEALLPPLLPSGDYQVVITLADEYAKKEVSKTLPLPVKGYDVEPSRDLTVRNIRYYRSEPSSQQEPMEQAAYRPGDTVWAQFDIAGFRLGEHNRFEVSYGIEVFRANGQSLYKEEEAARLAEANFYPKHALPGAFSLTLTPDLAKGPYAVALRVKDLAGNQSYETKTSFTVE